MGYNTEIHQSYSFHTIRNTFGTKVTIRFLEISYSLMFGEHHLAGFFSASLFVFLCIDLGRSFSYEKVRFMNSFNLSMIGGVSDTFVASWCLWQW